MRNALWEKLSPYGALLAKNTKTSDGVLKNSRENPGSPLTCGAEEADEDVEYKVRTQGD